MNYFLSLVFSMIMLNSFAATSLWQKVSGRNLTIEGERKIIPQIASLVQLNDADFRLFQKTIPAEGSTIPVQLILPTPDGGEMKFNVFESTCMEKALAEKYPMIKTYQAICVDNPFITAKLDYTEFGFHAMVFGVDGIYFIDPYSNVNTGYYNCYFKKDYTRADNNYSVCEVGDQIPGSQNRLIQQDNQGNSVTDGVRRTFRLALACTIEYSNAVAAPTVTKPRVLSAMVTSMNRVNGVYEKDLSIHMNLVAKNDTLIFIGSDNYSNNNGGAMLGENQTVCNARIGSANYDIGHVFSTGGGGVAFLGCVCNANNKARGVTGSSNPVGDAFDIDYVAHEMGHQFGANHTFNANSGSCSGNGNSSTAYEPGSGVTIMAYAGICGVNDIAAHSIDIFHRASIIEIFNYISGTSCAVITNSGNTPPTVTNYTATYSIPYKTSFEFTASATDPNGHAVNYCWEEWDIGPAGNWDAANNTTAPIFRSFVPTASGTRVFPRWDSLIRNVIKYKGEILPETTRDVKFRCTVRDIDANGYGAYNAPDNNLTIKSVTTATLFRVTSQATATTITGNTNQTVTWNVAGTTASPISCANVDIYLSLDSARTFPYLLASATANDGTESVLIPNVATNNASARIKVKGNGNVFFDLNDGWIKINPGTPPFAAAFTSSNTSICQGTSITFTNTSTGSPDSVRWTINGGTPSTSTSLTTILSTFNNSGTYTVSLTAYKAGVASTPFSTNITVNPKTTSSITQTICEGQSVTVGGQTFTTTQVNKVIVLPNANSKGCDSTITLNLTVNPKTTSSITQTICEGQSVTVGGQTFTTTQVNKVIVLANANSKGCDSTITLNLTVNPKTTSSITQTICEGQSVTVGGQTFTTTQVNKVIVLANANSKGCDSTITLNLTVNPKTTSSITQTICEGQSVTVGGQTFTTTQVNKVIVLPNANSKGCDSTITLNLTVNPKTTSSITQTICEGQSVTVGGQTFTTTQVNKVIVLPNANSKGCDSAITLNLTVNPKTTSSISQTICEGESVTVGGQTFTTTQVNKVIVLPNANSKGCDSTITLNLTVNPKSTSSITQTICEGQSVTVGGQTFTTTQVNKVIVLANANSKGCDSTITLNLTVNPKTTSSITQNICDGESVTVGGQTFTTTQINKVIVLPNANSKGCDSTITLNLTVNPKSTSSITQTICEGQSVTVGGQTFTTTQVNKVIVLANANSKGCDSTITLNLTVNPKTTSSISQNICDGESVTVGGQTFTTTQVNKVIVLPNANSKGCDSTITLNLTVNPKTTSSITQTICEGESVTIGGQTFTTTQVNKVILLPNANSKGCDSTITLNLTVNLVPSTPEITQSNDTLHSNVIISGASYEWYKGGVLLITTSSPFYKFTSNGTYTLRIINNDCASLLSASVNAALPTSVKTIKLDIQFDIIPNPNNGLFEVKIIVPKSGKYDLVLYNVAGQQLINEQLFIQQGSNVKRFNLDGIEKGMYFISVRGNDGISTKNIIVQ